jgi:hypothetical protein
LIPVSAGVKRQAGQGGSMEHAAQAIFPVSKTPFDNSQDSAVSFEQLSKVECQEYILGGLLIEHVKSNLNVTDFIVTDNILILQRE